jgi:hypothetical protein
MAPRRSDPASTPGAVAILGPILGPDRGLDRKSARLVAPEDGIATRPPFPTRLTRSAASFERTMAHRATGAPVE